MLPPAPSRTASPGEHEPTRTTAWDRAWVLLLAGLGVWGVVLAAQGRGFDLAIYLRAASRFVAGEGLHPVEDGAWTFKYAPATAWLFTPLLALPPRVAAAAWNVATVAALGWTAAIVLRLQPAARITDGAWARARVLATVALGQSLFLELFYGQVNVVLLLLLVLAADQAERGRAGRAGLAFALAVHLKPTAAILVLLLLMRRRFAALAAAAIAGAALWLPMLVRYGARGTLGVLGTWHEMLDRTTAPFALGHNSQGLPTALLSLLYPVSATPPGWTVNAAMLFAAALFVAALAAARPSPYLMVAWLCAGATLLSPQAWRANFVLLWPLLAGLLVAPEASWRRAGAALVAVFALVQLVVAEGVLGKQVATAVLFTRPFLLATLALLAFSAAAERRRRARRASADDDAPQTVQAAGGA